MITTWCRTLALTLPPLPLQRRTRCGRARRRRCERRWTSRATSPVAPPPPPTSPTPPHPTSSQRLRCSFASPYPNMPSRNRSPQRLSLPLVWVMRPRCWWRACRRLPRGGRPRHEPVPHGGGTRHRGAPHEQHGRPRGRGGTGCSSPTPLTGGRCAWGPPPQDVLEYLRDPLHCTHGHTQHAFKVWSPPPPLAQSPPCL